eukprot:3431090-Rhodomonas_salina.1
MSVMTQRCSSRSSTLRRPNGAQRGSSSTAIAYAQSDTGMLDCRYYEEHIQCAQLALTPSSLDHCPDCAGVG